MTGESTTGNEDVSALRCALAVQIRHAMRGEPVPCHICSTPIPLMFAFKCYYCGFWFCKKCAGEHFKPEAMQREQCPWSG